MNEDMRLKSVVVKGPRIGAIPCLKTCDKAKKCPCDELQKYLGDKGPLDLSCLEMEWIHIPKGFSLPNWAQWTFPIVTILLIALLLAKGCLATQSADKLKASFSEKGYIVECWTDSAESFEKHTNSILRIKKDLQLLK